MEFRLVERMILSPCRCFFCQRNDGPAIDTTVQRPAPVGRAYICESCGRDLIRLFGGVTADAVRQSEENVRTMRRELNDAEAEVRRLQPFERAIASARDEHLTPAA